MLCYGSIKNPFKSISASLLPVSTLNSTAGLHLNHVKRTYLDAINYV